MYSPYFIRPPCNSTRIVFTRTISDWNRLQQPIFLTRWVETFKAGVISIKYYSMKPIISFNLFLLSCAPFDIIFNFLLFEGGQYFVEIGVECVYARFVDGMTNFF